MRFETHDALVGRLLQDPVLEVAGIGRSRFVAQIVAQPRLRPMGDVGAFGAEITMLVATGTMAQRAYEQFTEGDHFIAVGAVRVVLCGASTHCGARLVFEAWHIGHDLTRSRYAVDRTRRRGAA